VIRKSLSVIAAAALLLFSGRAAAQQPAPQPAAAEAPQAGETAEARAERERDAEARAEHERDFETSVSGHRYRVRFDPASRLTVSGAATVLHDGEGGALVAFEAGFWFGYRKIYTYGTGEGRVIWQTDHQFTSGTVRPFVRPADGVPSLDATLYRGTLLRHSESPSIVLPFSPPKTVGFPFDVGLDAELGRVTIPVTPVVLPGFDKKAPWVHVGVVRTSFTLDPWRTGQPGRSLALGVGVRYDVDIYPAPTLGKPRFVHRIAPLTSGSARFRYQTDDGLLALDVFGEAAPHWTSENQWAFLANGYVRLDRTLIAINDRPIAAFAEVGYRYLPEGAGAPALHDLHGTLGIAASLGLK
jgi:hypothetical protein